MQMKHLAIALGTALAAQGAFASDVNWGEHGTLEFVASTVEPGAFSDTVLFTLPDATSLAATAVTNNLLSLLGITDAKLSLYFDNAGPDTLIGSFDFDGTTGSRPVTFTPTTGAGNYYYLITGLATGSSGGFYSLSSTTLPVPEPRTWSLALSGLLAAGLVARRRRGGGRTRPREGPLARRQAGAAGGGTRANCSTRTLLSREASGYVRTSSSGNSV